MLGKEQIYGDSVAMQLIRTWNSFLDQLVVQLVGENPSEEDCQRVTMRISEVSKIVLLDGKVVGIISHEFKDNRFEFTFKPAINLYKPQTATE